MMYGTEPHHKHATLHHKHSAFALLPIGIMLHLLFQLQVNILISCCLTAFTQNLPEPCIQHQYHEALTKIDNSMSSRCLTAYTHLLCLISPHCTWDLDIPCALCLISEADKSA